MVMVEGRIEMKEGRKKINKGERADGRAWKTVPTEKGREGEGEKREGGGGERERERKREKERKWQGEERVDTGYFGLWVKERDRRVPPLCQQSVNE
jgi:hypothetical protein